jgi:predicted GIY-YIG superfamily endonuclease
MLIYALELNGGKWYIGKTENIDRRVIEHLNSDNKWISSNGVLKVHILDKNASSPFMEDLYVKEFMKRYKIDNVRGGAYCKFNLDKDEVKTLRKEIRHAQNKCLNCGGDHFAKDCDEAIQKDKELFLNFNKCSLCSEETEFSNDKYCIECWKEQNLTDKKCILCDCNTLKKEYDYCVNCWYGDSDSEDDNLKGEDSDSEDDNLKAEDSDSEDDSEYEECGSNEDNEDSRKFESDSEGSYSIYGSSDGGYYSD